MDSEEQQMSHGGDGGVVGEEVIADKTNEDKELAEMM